MKEEKSMMVRRLRMSAAFRKATCDQVLLNYFISKRSWQTRNNSYRVRSYVVCLASVSLRFWSKESREERNSKTWRKMVRVKERGEGEEESRGSLNVPHMNLLVFVNTLWQECMKGPLLSSLHD